MGLSIHYSGTILNMDLLDDLMTETADICESLDWKYHLIDGHNDDELKGIILALRNASLLCSPFFPAAVYLHL